MHRPQTTNRQRSFLGSFMAAALLGLLFGFAALPVRAAGNNNTLASDGDCTTFLAAILITTSISRTHTQTNTKVSIHRSPLPVQYLK